MKSQNPFNPCSRWWLCLWIAIGTILRLWNLDLKSPWSDEWSTLVFGIGNGFHNIPFNAIISGNQLLEPAIFHADKNSQDVLQTLLTESNHPPLYFLFTHWWLKLTAIDGQLVSIWWGRSLAALLGIFSIPLTYIVAHKSFQNPRIAHFAALLIAISPYGVYLGQEARHYTFAIIWILLEWLFLLVAMRWQKEKKDLPIWFILAWISCNILGVSSHYFVLLNLSAQFFILFSLYIVKTFGFPTQWRIKHRLKYILKVRNLKIHNIKRLIPSFWSKVLSVILSSSVAIAILLHQWQGNQNEELTDWLTKRYDFGLEIIEPIGRSLLWGFSMIFVLPVEDISPWLAFPSVLILIGILIWFVPHSWRSLRRLIINQETQILVSGILTNLGILFIIVYGLHLDVSLAPRYHFIYFPPLVLLLAIILENWWQNGKKNTVKITLVLMLIGAIAVNTDGTYHKPHNAKKMVQLLALQNDPTPMLVTRYKSHAQIEEMMSIAWEIQRQKLTLNPRFLILENQRKNAEEILLNIIAQQSQSFNLWLFNTPLGIPARYCTAPKKYRVEGYWSKQYYCVSPKKIP